MVCHNSGEAESGSAYQRQEFRLTGEHSSGGGTRGFEAFLTSVDFVRLGRDVNRDLIGDR